MNDLWTCPQCGARLVSRNLWHSCGEFSLEALFKGADPGVLEAAQRYVEMLHSLGDVQVLPQKSRLTCVARVRFAGLTPLKRGFWAGFALHRWLDHPRVQRGEEYGPNWRLHRVKITKAEDLDDELRAWLQESHDVVGLQSHLSKAKSP